MHSMNLAIQMALLNHVQHLNNGDPFHFTLNLNLAIQMTLLNHVQFTLAFATL